MSKPSNCAITPWTKAIQHTIFEIGSGISSLNMLPDQISQVEMNQLEEDGEILFLSLTDKNVSHALEHLRQAHETLDKLYEDITKFEEKFLLFAAKYFPIP